MTIQKFGPYGTPVPHPSKLVVLRSDREIAQHFIAHEFATPCTVTKGSIAHSLGVKGGSIHRGDDPGQQLTLVNIDLLRIDYRTKTSGDSGLQLIVAGTLAVQRRSLFSACLLLSNSGLLHGRDILPRSHPNDGFVDVLEIDQRIKPRQRVLAWRRSKTGSHLPHPFLRVSRSSDFEWSGRPSRMIADGVTYTGVVWLKCTVLADAMRIHF